MKNHLKKAFIPFLSSPTISALASRVIDCGVTVFLIHRMSSDGEDTPCITPDHLRNCLSYLTERGYHLAALEELLLSLQDKTQLPDKTVVFTLDDGYIDQAELAIPIFAEYNCPITFFVITGLLDHTLWPWDAQVSWIVNHSRKPLLEFDLGGDIIHAELGSPGKRRMARQKIRDIIKELDNEAIQEILPYLAECADVSIPEVAPVEYQPIDWNMARELEANGVRFAPHSRTHLILSKLNKSSMKEEILGSWQTLQKELANPLKVFCYPTGRIMDFGPREIEFLKERGFLGAVSTIPAAVDIQKNQTDLLYRLPRFELPANMIDFVQYCSWIEHAKHATH